MFAFSVRWPWASSAKLGRVTPGVSGGHLLMPAPKQAMGNVVFTGSMVPHNQEHSLQSMATAYRKFMIDWSRLHTAGTRNHIRESIRGGVAGAPNQALHLTSAACRLSHDSLPLVPPWQVSLFVRRRGPDASACIWYNGP